LTGLEDKWTTDTENKLSEQEEQADQARFFQKDWTTKRRQGRGEWEENGVTGKQGQTSKRGSQSWRHHDLQPHIQGSKETMVSNAPHLF